jgi:hypothetical protein
MSPITPKLSRSVLYVRAHNVPRVLTFVWVVEDVCHWRLGSCCPFEITPIIMTRNSSAGTQHSLGSWFQDATKIGFLVGNNADGLLTPYTLDPMGVSILCKNRVGRQFSRFWKNSRA